MPLASGSWDPPPSPPGVSSSFGSNLSPKTGFASFVCGSVRSCKWSAMSSLSRVKEQKNQKNSANLHHDFLWRETLVHLHFKVDNLRLRVVVERLDVAGSSFLCVCAQFLFDVGFVLVCGVAKSVVGVISKETAEHGDHFACSFAMPWNTPSYTISLS